MTAVRRALLISTADRYFTYASSFAVAAAVSRILTPAEIGVSVVGIAILGIALSVREFASSSFLIQREALTREDVRASFTVMLVLTAIVVVALLAATPALARLYGEKRLIGYFHVICVCLFLDLISVQVITLLRRDMAYGRIVAIDAASGTQIIRSTTPGRKLGSTRGRPIPSMRDARPVETPVSPSRQPGKNAEFSGSTTARQLSCRR